MRDASAGTQVRNKLLSRAALEASPVPLPSLARQEQIAAQYSTVDRAEQVHERRANVGEGPGIRRAERDLRGDDLTVKPPRCYANRFRQRQRDRGTAVRLSSSLRRATHRSPFGQPDSEPGLHRGGCAQRRRRHHRGVGPSQSILPRTGIGHDVADPVATTSARRSRRPPSAMRTTTCSTREDPTTLCAVRAMSEDRSRRTTSCTTSTRSAISKAAANLAAFAGRPGVGQHLPARARASPLTPPSSQACRGRHRARSRRPARTPTGSRRVRRRSERRTPRRSNRSRGRSSIGTSRIAVVMWAYLSDGYDSSAVIDDARLAPSPPAA